MIGNFFYRPLRPNHFARGSGGCGFGLKKKIKINGEEGGEKQRSGFCTTPQQPVRDRDVLLLWFLCKAMSVLRQTRRPRSLSSPLPALLMVCGERSVSVRIRILESLFSFSTLPQIGHASLFCERSKPLGVKARCADSLGQDVEIICVGPPHTASRLGGRWTRVVRGCCELANAFEQPVFGPSGRGRVCVFFYRQFPPGGERAESICGCARHRNRF